MAAGGASWQGELSTTCVEKPKVIHTVSPMWNARGRGKTSPRPTCPVAEEVAHPLATLRRGAGRHRMPLPDGHGLERGQLVHGVARWQRPAASHVDVCADAHSNKHGRDA